MPVGRIVLKSISESKKLSSLKTDGARLLYTWLIPHLNVNGCFSADPVVIRGRVFTRLDKSINEINEYLDDLENNSLIVRYNTSGDDFLIMPNFADKQPKLNKDREGKVNIPLPTQEQLKSKSRVTQTQIKLSEVKLNKANATHEQVSPADNSTPSAVTSPPASLKTEPEKPVPEIPRPGGTISKPPAEELTPEQDFIKHLTSAIRATREKYPTAYEQKEIETFIAENLRKYNRSAIIHCINSLAKVEVKANHVKLWLNAALKTHNGGENGKYNAAQSEADNDRNKSSTIPADILTKIVKTIPDAKVY